MMAKFQEYRERKEKEYQESYDRRIALRYLTFVFRKGGLLGSAIELFQEVLRIRIRRNRNFWSDSIEISVSNSNKFLKRSL